jgi:transmembrane sensor
MQQKKFEELFESYLQNNLSEVEQQKMMDIIAQGAHDDFIKEKIHMMLKGNHTKEAIDSEQGEFILNYILSKPENEPKVITLEPVRRNKKIVRFVFAAASVIVLAFIGSTFFFKSSPVVRETVIEQPAVAENTLIDFSGKQLVHLPDGSTVLLNDNSSLKYDQSTFDTKTREVTLIGEAFFDIKHNEEKPFIVHTGKVQTKVLGTAFNINARNSSNDIEVTVARGKVQVGDTEKIYGVITPNQQIKVNKTTLDYQQNTISAAIVTEWKSNYLILDDINMQEAVALISQKYKAQILLSNEKIKNCRITASFLNEEDLDHVLKVICSVIETEYHYNKAGTIILEGKGCE